MAKKITFLSLLTVFALILSYLEGLFCVFIPVVGFKVGLANTLCLILIFKNKYVEAIIVNLLRILLSALLFGNLFSLLFSLAGGTVSILATILLKKLPFLSAVGVSTISAALHNTAQVICAVILLSSSAVYSLLPPLLFLGALCGFLCGIAANIFSKKYGHIITDAL